MSRTDGQTSPLPLLKHLHTTTKINRRYKEPLIGFEQTILVSRTDRRTSPLPLLKHQQQQQQKLTVVIKNLS